MVKKAPNRSWVQRVLSFIVTLSIIFSCVRIMPLTAQAGTIYSVVPDITKPTPINFINGSFQDPTLEMNIPGQANTIANALAWGWNWYPVSEVPGWSTIPVNSSDGSDPYARHIEIQRVNINNHYEDTFQYIVANGDQYAELNAAVVGRLYQNCATTPGTRIYWQFAHSARKGPSGRADSYDTLNFYLRPAGSPETTPAGEQLQYSSTSNAEQWYYRRGVYTVPPGQTNTEFCYESVSTSEGHQQRGNFIDDIKFQTGAKLILEKSVTTSLNNNTQALNGEIVTITVEITNWGENDASRCVFSDILDDHLTYIPGSARIDGTDAGDKATFNSTTGELKINFGESAANTQGGVLSGSQVMGTSGTTNKGAVATITFQAEVNGNDGDKVYNQAKVSYNDKDYESYNIEDFENYSYVKGKTVNASDSATYINEFEILDDTVSFTIQKDLVSAAEEEEQFVFQVDYCGSDTTAGSVKRTMYAVITIKNQQQTGAADFVNMPRGWYTVTELNSNWRFDLQKDELSGDNAGAFVDAINGSVTRYITDAPTIFTYRNKRRDVPWVNGKGSVTNNMPVLTGS